MAEPGAAEARTKVALASTGVANLASVMAAFRRAGAEPYLAASPDELAAEAFAVVPGVGSFGSAVSALEASGMDRAIRDRITRGAPTMGVCAGMQVFFESSEESPGSRGLGILPGRFGRFPSSLPVPQLGWNRVSGLRPETEAPAKGGGPNMVGEGWAYFANSYRLREAPEGFRAAWAEYGEDFVAALEPVGAGGARLLLCQFHPELSGPWGLGLLRAWLGSVSLPEGGTR
jgi:imidazole glycerol-phosphate synthase subunit HisH